MDLEHAWSGITLLREMESACAGVDSGKSFWDKALYWEKRATAETLVGNHRSAIEYGAKLIRHHPDGIPAQMELPQSAVAEAAVPYIVMQAMGHRVVMVNEAHWSRVQRSP